MARTYNNLYLDIRQQLLGGGIGMASLEAREIMRHVTGKGRLEIARDYHLYVPLDEERQALDLLRRRLEGEPIAYIVGEWEFFGLPMEVTPDVLIPRVDTEVLTAAAIDAAKKAGPGARVLDLCAGSGCIGLAVAAYVPECRVVMIEISEAALKIARRNVRRHDLMRRITCLAADALISPKNMLGSFDVIACNPPYVSAAEWTALDDGVRRHEPMLALDGGEDGLRFFRAVSRHWRQALKPGGRLMFECGAHQASAVCDILGKAAYGLVETLKDSRHIDRVVIGAPVWNDAIREGIAEIV
jgi:release factor glutamine methyltransferase